MKIRETLKAHSADAIMQIYKVSRRTAYNWLSQGYAVRREYPDSMPKVDYLTVAQHSAVHYAGRSHDSDLLAECRQGALIALWKCADTINNARDPLAMAYTVGAAAARDALLVWKAKEGQVALDDWLPLYEQDGVGSLDMDSGDYASDAL